MARLAAVCEINPPMPRSLIDEEKVAFLPMAAVSEDGHVSFEDERTAGEVKRGYTYFERGDVLVAKITPCFENGKAARTSALSRPVGFGSTEFHVLRAGQQIDSSYLFHMIWNSRLRDIGAQNMTGSAGQKRVPADFLKRLEIPLPPLDEQRRIATILDKADALRRKYKRFNELAHQLGHSIFCSVQERTKQTSKEFCFSEVAQEGSGNFGNGPFGSDLLTSELKSEGVPVVYIRDIVTQNYVRVSNSFVSAEKAAALSACSIRPKDLLITKVGEPPGVATVYPDGEPNAIITQDVIRLRPDPAIAVSEYLAYLLNSSLGKHLIAGITVAATRARFSLRDLKQLKILLPSIEEQHAFKAQIDFLNRTKRAELAARETMSSMFESLQHHAFSGQL